MTETTRQRIAADLACRIKQRQRRCGISTCSVAAIESGGYRWLGPQEQYGHLLGQAGYVAVYDSDQIQTTAALAAVIEQLIAR